MSISPILKNPCIFYFYCYKILSNSYYVQCKTPTVQSWRGHKNSTFYVKTALSPNDQFLLSGSSDDKAYIWDVSFFAEIDLHFAKP